ncbi:MAG TPA: HlyD family secretion protein [Planctomycetota bacterium]|nr:HlyD family secretion protein [Planctomycetota bacterium]
MSEIGVLEPAVAQAPAPSPSRRRALKIGAAALGTVALASAVGLGVHALDFESTDDAFVEGHVTPISPKVSGNVIAVHFDDNATVTSGAVLVEIDPRDFEVRLADARAALDVAEANQKNANAGFELTKIRAEARIDQAAAGLETAKAAVGTARALLDGARSRFEQTKAGVASARAGLEQAREDLPAAEADTNRASLDQKRYEEAIATRSVSRQDLERVTAEAASMRARLASAKARVRAAEAQLNEAESAHRNAQDGITQAESQVKESESRVRDAEAMLASAKGAPHEIETARAAALRAAADRERALAQVRQAELDLSYTTIRAPQSGQIARKSVEPGAFVGVAQTLFAIVPKEMWVVANFKETQLTYMRPGQKAELRVDAYPGRVFAGHVDSLQLGTGARFSLLPAENATGNYVKIVQRVPVKLVFDEVPDGVLLAPGMSVEPEVRVR